MVNGKCVKLRINNWNKTKNACSSCGVKSNAIVHDVFRRVCMYVVLYGWNYGGVYMLIIVHIGGAKKEK